MSKVNVSRVAQPDFAEVVHLITAARQHAYQAVNTTLIELYWQVGAIISNKIKASVWGDGVVDALAKHLATTQPNLKGFTRANLFRMRQFYETYQDDKIVAPLVRQLPWTHNLIILSQSKRPEEREFYLKMAVQEKWSGRELERQFNTALFERMALNPEKLSTSLKETQAEALSVFKDSYVVEFLNLPKTLIPTSLIEHLYLILKASVSSSPSVSIGDPEQHYSRVKNILLGFPPKARGNDFSAGGGL